jgi:hypothetical protein
MVNNELDGFTWKDLSLSHLHVRHEISGGTSIVPLSLTGININIDATGDSHFIVTGVNQDLTLCANGGGSTQQLKLCSEGTGSDSILVETLNGGLTVNSEDLTTTITNDADITVTNVLDITATTSNIVSTTNIGNSTTLNTIAATTGYSGAAGSEQTLGGMALMKNVAGQDGSVTPQYSQAIYFGPPTVNGTWRMAVEQPTNATATSTTFVIQVLSSGSWVTKSTLTQ